MGGALVLSWCPTTTKGHEMTSIYAAAFETGRALGKDHGEAAEYAKEVAARAVCRYSLMHQTQGTPAVNVLDCGPVGKVDACQPCTDFYGRMS